MNKYLLYNVCSNIIGNSAIALELASRELVRDRLVLWAE